MRLHTLWPRIPGTPWTPAIFLWIFWCISDQYSIISTFSGLFRLLDIRAILHVDRTATATYYQSHRSMLHLFHPSYLRPIISLEIEVFSLISHGHGCYCDALLKRWLLHSSHDIPIHFAIFIIWFRIFSPFYIYLTLPYPHKKNRREIRPPIVWDYCDFTATAFPLRLRFHCDCVLHLVLRLLAIDLRPIIVFSIEFSIEFLSHFYRIASRTSHRHIAHRDCL